MTKEDRIFLSSIKDLVLLDNSKSIRIAKDDFNKFLSLTKLSDETYNKLRSLVIKQDGYGMDSCGLCGAKWMRSFAIENTHIDCLLSPTTKPTKGGGDE